jgi:hypothetical protein
MFQIAVQCVATEVKQLAGSVFGELLKKYLKRMSSAGNINVAPVTGSICKVPYIEKPHYLQRELHI